MPKYKNGAANGGPRTPVSEAGAFASTAFALYLEEVRRVGKLLTAAEEQALGREMERARTAVRTLQYTLRNGATPRAKARARGRITREKMRLARARAVLAQANVRLVISIARRHLRWGVELEDLVQAGNVGLMRAVDKYDWRRGFKFSTYATWWIRQGISRFIDDTVHTIRVSVSTQQLLRRLGAFESEYAIRHRRSPSAQEMARALAIPESERTNRTSSQLTVRELLALRNSFRPHSLDAAEDEGDSRNGRLFHELVPDTQMGTPEEQFAERDFEYAVISTINGLTVSHGVPLDERAKVILKRRLGLGGEVASLGSIAKEFGITRERVRQIFERTIPTLKRALEHARLRSS